MGRTFTAASLALPVVLAAVTLSLLAARAEEPPARVELEIAAVLPLPEGPGRLLVLREKPGGNRVLAFVVPDGEALSGAPGPPAPRPPGLLGRMLAALGATVREVEIDRAEEVGSAARVHVEQDGKRFTVAARPSESVALAIDAGAPIVATRALLDADGLSAEDLARARAEADATPATEL